MLSDICANSDADVLFDKLTFSITGSDDSVKDALMVIAQIRFVTRSQYQIRVKIELANEHKEFVSGKKNGKINKIMGQSRVYGATIVRFVLTILQVAFKLFLTGSMNITSILTFVEATTKQ